MTRVIVATVVACQVQMLLPSFAAHGGEIEARTQRGIVAVLGLPDAGAASVVELAVPEERIVYFQSASGDEVSAVRAAASQAGLLGSSICAHEGSLDRIHLASNIADEVFVSSAVQSSIDQDELLRVVRPQGAAVVGGSRIVKPVPDGYDDWSHAYHGPDNNPQSRDEYVRGRFHTHFLSIPKFSPMPEQSVAAGGRLYKAMGHIAHKANQNRWLNKLLCINAYNGTILWERDLPEGFLIHRNTMIATDDALLMGDHESCKVFDGETGEIRDEITVPEELTDGPVWKWMALRDGVLYGLVGNLEVQVDTQRSARRGLGHWPWGMWEGHDYNDPRTAFGFGRTVVAIDLESKEVLWHYRDEEFLDARAVCMNSDKIFCFTAERFLACLDRETGSLLWKNTDEELLSEVGPNSKAQHYLTGYATTCYMKCDEQRVYFAGPQREKMVVASADDGSLQWTNPTGNLQLVLREDGIYAAGKQGTTGLRLAYDNGSVLSEFPARRACTRATGCGDSIFYRASGGTVRVFTESNTAQHIAPMRPPCQDGVLVSNGHLYWGPWMCGCQLSLYGNICLEPAEAVSGDAETIYADALTIHTPATEIEPISADPRDWSVYRGTNARSDESAASVPDAVEQAWEADISTSAWPTAPIVAGEYVFLADRSGRVHALSRDGQPLWQATTGGPIYYPPALAGGRLLVGSADGRVYAYDARSGSLLWTFRVAPRDSLIPVYGRLVSRWPLAGGVVVDGETVYAAAGIAHYDGTYVVALDAATGKLRAANVTSGTISEEVDNGISMQGNLSIVGEELQFLGGGVYEVARYDLQTLACLNEPKVQVTSEYRTAFYPWYPDYGKYVSLDHTCQDGCTLSHDASYEGSQFTNLARYEPLPEGVTLPPKEAARWLRRRGKEDAAPEAIWQDQTDRRFTSFAVTPDRLLATAHADETPDRPILVASTIEDGTDLWQHPLPAGAVKGGMAIDRDGRIYVAMENGRLRCYQPK